MDFCPTSYNGTHPYPNCTAAGGFQFNLLWQITQYIAQWPEDPRLYSPSMPSITQAACVAFVGAGWAPYPAADIWSRLTAWKFPLLQLVAIFPRPPLGFKTGMFVIVQLLGNPVGTLKNLLLKVASCQSRAQDWADFFSRKQVLFEGEVAPPNARDFEEYWKALAVVIDSYDEWGYEVGTDVQLSFQMWL
jgi:hypothetical protein